MADTQTTVALNIGAQRIAMAVFETSKSGSLVIKGYETDTIIADPSFEASREAKIQVSIANLVEKLKVPKSKVRYAISGQAAFIRFVKLPPIQDDNIEQLVTFEAQQHVPFPINEVVWDYELIESGDEKDVVIVAIKSDALNEIDDTVNATGLTTAEVDVAPMALYNAFIASYGAPEETVLIIDIGAKTSNLLYLEGKRFFTRSVAIGGASVSSAISKEYGISFPDAEHQKIANGLVALGGGHTETMDESVAALAMVIRNALTRLPAEIARTTNYYRSQHGGKAPTKVLLAGGGVNLPYTLEFLNEKLNLPVEYFNPLTQVSIGKGVDTELLQREAHTMGELVGLGLRGIGKSTINIDLVPSAVEVSRAEQRRKPFLIAAAALLVLGFAIWAVLQHLAAGKAEERSKEMAETRDSLAPVERDIRSLLKKEEELKTVATAYTSNVSDHAFWFELFSELREAFSSDSLWLTEMTPLYDYAPAPVGEPAPKLNVVVKDNFDSKSNNESSIESPPAPVKPVQSKKNKKSKRAKLVEKPAGPMANAILIKGFWRENSRSQNLVTDLLARLRENTEIFTFDVTDEKGEVTTLGDERISQVQTGAREDGDLAFSFSIVLPLAKPVQIK
ncbi:MAG: Amuc_1101 family PilM-like pilus complex protein [Luteolibacter sp.]